MLTILCTSLVGHYDLSHTETKIGNDATQELIELYHKFRESILKDTTGELVDSSEIYVKLIEKEDSENLSTYSFYELSNDYKVEYHTREEFEKEYSPITTFGIGSL